MLPRRGLGPDRLGTFRAERRGRVELGPRHARRLARGAFVLARSPSARDVARPPRRRPWPSGSRCTIICAVTACRARSWRQTTTSGGAPRPAHREAIAAPRLHGLIAGDARAPSDRRLPLLFRRFGAPNRDSRRTRSARERARRDRARGKRARWQRSRELRTTAERASEPGTPATLAIHRRALHRRRSNELCPTYVATSTDEETLVVPLLSSATTTIDAGGAKRRSDCSPASRRTSASSNA